jgi:hypothetical protein
MIGPEHDFNYPDIPNRPWDYPDDDEDRRYEA